MDGSQAGTREIEGLRFTGREIDVSTETKWDFASTLANLYG